MGIAKKILIVDDDKDILNTMKKVLEKEKYKVQIATNGADAIDLMQGAKPNLILIDIKLPVLSGYDLFRLLRTKLYNNIKIIYVTIVPKQEVDLKDVDGFIQKPFDIDLFVKQIKKFLK